MGAIRRYIKPVMFAVPKIIGNYFTWIKCRSDKPDKYDQTDTWNKFCKIATQVSKTFDIGSPERIKRYEVLKSLTDDADSCLALYITEKNLNIRSE